MEDEVGAQQVRVKGRPRVLTDEAILRAALRAFAESGFEAMSVRGLNASLGLSHEAISQRFGSKRDLYFAALDFGFADFFAAVATERATRPAPVDDLGELRETIRTFMAAASVTPELGRLVNHEGLVASERLDYIVEHAFESGTRVLADLAHRLFDAGLIRPISARELFFLAQAGAAPFTITALSATFDPIDGPLDPAAHIDRITDVIVQGLLDLPS
jgi:TetR/AcrR family transcriptional regulator